MVRSAKKKAPPEGGALVVEAGFIQARNLSSSGSIIRNLRRSGKSLLNHWPESLNSGEFRLLIAIFVLAILAGGFAGPGRAEPAHGIAMHGEPALPQGFTHLPYANPEAPKGGRVVFGETGGFDSLNPYLLKGRAPWGVRAHTIESLMARSQDEPFTLYGLLAESVETPNDRSWVEFTLRPEARFSDGAPVTVEDVIWSLETVAAEGHPVYRNAWNAVSGVAQTGPRSLRISFSEPNRELALIVGMRPVLKKAEWAEREFAVSTLEPITGSGPYVVDRFEPGRFISFRRNPDYWGRDLAVNRGLHNFDEIKYEYYRNSEALWSAVKTGEVSVFRDSDAARWADGYDFPAALDGRLTRGEISHGRPTGMYGFVFNTRREIFADRRVREALALSFDWEWVNQRLFRGQYKRIESYFANSPLEFDGIAEGREAELLAPFVVSSSRTGWPEDALEAGWRPPASDGTGRDRANLRAAARLLEAAGWKVNGRLRQNAAGVALSFEVLVGSTGDETLAELWSRALGRLGVELRVRRVDNAQYVARRREYDFDMTVNRWFLSLSPGVEQRLYFGAHGRADPGTRNYMGVDDEAVESMIAALLSSTNRPDFESAVRTLDRVLSAGIYVIPFGHLPTDRVAWQKGYARPERDALYGWRPEVWWKVAE
jgi:peptide/nickel transport system substrate-binding protein